MVMMWTRKEWIEEDNNILLCIGQEYMEEDKDGEYIIPDDYKPLLCKIWDNYTRQDWINNGFYKIRGKVFDLYSELGVFRDEVSRDTFVKACNLVGVDYSEYRYYL